MKVSAIAVYNFCRFYGNKRIPRSSQYPSKQSNLQNLLKLSTTPHNIINTLNYYLYCNY